MTNTGKQGLAGLVRDARGNTIAIMAAALIPISAMVGSGVDVARMYYVKVRLQQACDAGALAGRKFMVGTDFDTNASTQATSFFNNNFRSGTFGSTDISFTPSKTSDNQVKGEAYATVPMTVMKMFGKDPQQIHVTCQARLEIPNLDMMFVLDTTLSMTEINPGDSVSRISALRSSVTSFYNTLESSKASGTQIRYGFVPYSSTVNVGALLKREWMVDNWTYQSRVFNSQETIAGGTQGATIDSYTAWVFQSGTRTITTYTIPPESCIAPANQGYTSVTTNGAWNQTARPHSRTQTNVVNGTTYSAALSGGICTVTKTVYNNYTQTRTHTESDNPNAGQQNGSSERYYWDYKPIAYDVSLFKGSAGNGLMAGGTLTARIDNNYPVTPRNVPWGGTNKACIEERDTVKQSDYTSIPSAAYDLNVDMIPDQADPRTQWRPFLPGLVYARSQTGYSSPPAGSWTYAPVIKNSNNFVALKDYTSDRAACPAAARKLATITSAQLTTYLNTLSPAGLTYHDIGFLWGLRLLSAEGIFGSENQTAPNGSAIARHLIFMTDGTTETNIADYDAYGLSALDRRRAGSSTTLPTIAEQNTIVENRLKALCTAGKNKNITVWVIAFGTSLTDLLRNCGSPNRSYQANNSTELNDTFSRIASQIAQLRIAK